MDIGSEIYAELLRREREALFASPEFAQRAAFYEHEQHARPARRGTRQAAGFHRPEPALPLF